MIERASLSRSLFPFFNYRKKISTLTFYERLFRGNLLLAALLTIVLMLAIFLTLVMAAMPSIKQLGFSFLISHEWNPVSSEFGAVPFLAGTLITSALALLLS